MNRNAVRLAAALLVLLAGLGVWLGRPMMEERAPALPAPAPQAGTKAGQDAAAPGARARPAGTPGRANAEARRPPLDDPDVAAEVARTLGLIERGGPFPHRQDGAVFRNREGRLPPGDYREFTVETPGAHDRGARRIVVERTSGRRYYTGDHYRSFIPLDPPAGGTGRGGGR